MSIKELIEQLQRKTFSSSLDDEIKIVDWDTDEEYTVYDYSWYDGELRIQKKDESSKS